MDLCLARRIFWDERDDAPIREDSAGASMDQEYEIPAEEIEVIGE